MATKPTAKYPRVYVSPATHKRVLVAAKKQGKHMKDIGDAIIKAGLKALGYAK